MNINEIRDALDRKLVGQAQAVDELMSALVPYAAGLHDVKKPVGSALLAGPTGVGKTHTSEVLASILHHDPSKFIRIDCSEFAESHHIARLIGSPPGYIGHRETKPLIDRSEIIANRSIHCDLTIICLDEIEKANEALFRLLLGILDHGSMRHGDRTVTNFDDTLILMTSNLGTGTTQIGLTETHGIEVMRAVRKFFAPEFINRLDAIVVYKPLDTDSLRKILNIILEDLQCRIAERMPEQRFVLTVTPEVKEYLLYMGTSKLYGARELKRAVHKLLWLPLCEMLVLGNSIASGEVVTYLVRGKIELRWQRPTLETLLLVSQRVAEVRKEKERGAMKKNAKTQRA